MTIYHVINGEGDCLDSAKFRNDSEAIKWGQHHNEGVQLIKETDHTVAVWSLPSGVQEWREE